MLARRGSGGIQLAAQAVARLGSAVVLEEQGPRSTISILARDEHGPLQGEIERFHAALASLAEIVAVIALGLTVGLHSLPDGAAWGIGLTLEGHHAPG
jgi:potassium/hydrogen antiporter